MLASNIYVRCESWEVSRCGSLRPFLTTHSENSNLRVWRVVRVGPIERVADPSGMGATSLAPVHHVNVRYSAAG